MAAYLSLPSLVAAAVAAFHYLEGMAIAVTLTLAAVTLTPAIVAVELASVVAELFSNLAEDSGSA